MDRVWPFRTCSIYYTPVLGEVLELRHGNGWYLCADGIGVEYRGWPGWIA